MMMEFSERCVDKDEAALLLAELQTMRLTGEVATETIRAQEVSEPLATVAISTPTDTNVATEAVESIHYSPSPSDWAIYWFSLGVAGVICLMVTIPWVMNYDGLEHVRFMIAVPLGTIGIILISTLWRVHGQFLWPNTFETE